jgi:signal transduction histidine kinase
MVSSQLISSLLKISDESGNQSEPRESPLPASGTLRVVGSASLVGIAYYLGTRLGFALTPSGQPNSTFWPPNAILLAAFLLFPVRMWWAFLLAVLPAHLLAQLQTGIPIFTALGWFVTNSSEALIGAFCVKRFANQESLFDSVRGVLAFVVFGVILAPFATSFLDAAAVIMTHWGRGYLPITTERFWTNALAVLTIVPTIVLWATRGRSWIQKATPSRYWEAILLSAATVLVSLLAFVVQPVSPATTPALLYAPLPLLLWATLRFGAGGFSLSFLSTVLISIWSMLHGREPFPYASLPQNVLSLQILFCSVAVPLMFLSAIMAEAQRSQRSVRDMSVSLLKAQEQERARIGRELHDDINQRLALLAAELGQLQEHPLEVQSRLQQLQEELAQISNDVQGLSHELHPSKLEYLGVVAGIKSWCKEFSERQRIEISFKNDVSSVLPSEIGVSLFRVLQEALHNTVKHSAAKSIEVQILEQANEVHLIVCDSGKGFDVEAAKQSSRGLGLTSMQERVRLVNGTLSIESKPGGGTRIHVCVPLGTERFRSRAVG